MTLLKRLAITIFETLVNGFVTAAPFLGAPHIYRAYGMPVPLHYQSRTPR